MTYYGNCHFVSLQAAYFYYAEYGQGWKAVRRKLAEKEIAIGPPKVQPGQRLTIIDAGKRYAIQEVTL